VAVYTICNRYGLSVGAVVMSARHVHDFKYWQQNIRKVLKCITNTAFTDFCNLAGTDYELPEDDAIASKHVEAA
jgi:hypothetical protein